MVCTKLLHTLPSIVPHGSVSRKYVVVAKARMIYTYKLHSFLRLWQSSENQLGQCLFNNLFGKERAMRSATTNTTRVRATPAVPVLLYQATTAAVVKRKSKVHLFSAAP